MKFTYIESLACPYHIDHPLRLDVSVSKDQDVVEGALVCPACERTFLIHEGIPDLRPDELKSGKTWRTTGWIPHARGWDKDRLTRLVTAIRAPQSWASINRPTAPPQDWLVLDIGCGSTPRGTVNMDVYVPHPIPPDFVLGSAELLPFSRRSFDLVTSHFVIEHVLEPARFIKSQVQCARKQVEIVTDNIEWIGDRWFRIFKTGRLFHDEHCYCWTKEYLDNLVRRLGYQGYTTGYVLPPTHSLIAALSDACVNLPRIGIFFVRYLRTVILVQDGQGKMRKP